MDHIDSIILTELMRKGRVSWAELAGRVGLTSPGLMDRVRRLEAKKVIRGYKAVLDPEALGLDLMAFVSVALEKPSHRAAFLKRIKMFVEIQECHQVSGDDDYILKIRCSNMKHLDQVVGNGLKSMAGVVRIKTTIVMNTEKETIDLPLPSIAEDSTPS